MWKWQDRRKRLGEGGEKVDRRINGVRSRSYEIPAEKATQQQKTTSLFHRFSKILLDTYLLLVTITS